MIAAKYSIPYNGDETIVDRILSDYSPYIDCFYGSFGSDFFGGGRALKTTKSFDLEEAKKILKKLRKYGIEFNYVINNTNQLNREYEPEFISQYLKFIEKLQMIDVGCITLCNSKLIEITKDYFPSLKISGSVNLKVRTLSEVKYVQKLGCDELTLHYDILKNFFELKEINDKCDIKKKLIPNDLYIQECPWQKGHTRMQGAHSRTNNNAPYFSYYRNKCVNIRNYYSEEILRGMWIPPTDQQKYIDLGYWHFKLLDRLADTQWIISALEAYIKQEQVENLETLLGTYGRKGNNVAMSEIRFFNEIYPTDHLEAVPSIHIKKRLSDNMEDFCLKNQHLRVCGGCSGCKQLVEHNVFFENQSNAIARHNNYYWQKFITKQRFIEMLNTYQSKRIEYKG